MIGRKYFARNTFHNTFQVIVNGAGTILSKAFNASSSGYASFFNFPEAFLLTFN